MPTSTEVPRLGSSRPPLHDAGDSACGTPQRFFGGGGANPLCLTASVVRGAATLDACRALLPDHLSYGARRGNPPFARGPPPAVRLGWRLAARTGPYDCARGGNVKALAERLNLSLSIQRTCVLGPVCFTLN
ncbi:unnamed protein product [Pleuronectes platessa]|uniref:Uncharacterized protein n=1 Tax=Pleuronectes platessa TaxID=8262 RepID=A0A9N7YLY1_PLEPL|nr:unnamed protein product [Pleuronectes platessa]